MNNHHPGQVIDWQGAVEAIAARQQKRNDQVRRVQKQAEEPPDVPNWALCIFVGVFIGIALSALGFAFALSTVAMGVVR